MPFSKDLLPPSPEEEERTSEKKRPAQSPNSYFVDVKCPGRYKINTMFGHVQTVVLSVGCSAVPCQPTGGQARLTKDAPLGGSGTKAPWVKMSGELA